MRHLHQSPLATDFLQELLLILRKIQILRFHSLSSVDGSNSSFFFSLKFFELCLYLGINEIRYILPVNNLRNNIVRPVSLLQFVEFPPVHRVHSRAPIFDFKIALKSSIRIRTCLCLFRSSFEHSSWNTRSSISRDRFGGRNGKVKSIQGRLCAPALHLHIHPLFKQKITSLVSNFHYSSLIHCRGLDEKVCNTSIFFIISASLRE
mmetsp:Transcript_18661/g.39232  ORF Transcript_18661/g.39232 Transcript_18661/m.39232 type:complete len:206 (+) Transcript_18661:846-1463(+)